MEAVDWREQVAAGVLGRMRCAPCSSALLMPAEVDVRHVEELIFRCGACGIDSAFDDVNRGLCSYDAWRIQRD